MAPPPRIRTLQRESLPGAPAWVDPLLLQVSEALGQTSKALSKGLTFSENFQAQMKDVSFLAPAPVWTAPTLLNSHANLGAGYEPIEYTMETGGWVNLRGVWVPGATDTVVFTLPEGYRPPNRVIFNPSSATGAPFVLGRLDVETNGGVHWYSGGTSYASMSGLRFQATTPAAPPAPPSGGGWPLAVKHSLPSVAGVLPVRVLPMESLGKGLAGAPCLDWAKANDSTILLRNVSGLVPGRRYTLTLLLFAR